MFDPDENGVYQTIYPTFGRRIVALAAYYALSILLIWLAMGAGLGVVALLAVLALGLFLLYVAERLRRSSQHGISLTTRGLEETSGRVIVTWDEVEKVERGTFVLKPSNGFSVILREAGPRSWSPGLWWRTRRRVGVGGVLAGPQSRTLAELMAHVLPEYQPQSD